MIANEMNKTSNDMKEQMKDLIEQYDKGGFTYDELEWELLNLFGVINFVCPDCKGDNMIESNKREVWCNDCEKNYRENDC